MKKTLNRTGTITLFLLVAFFVLPVVSLFSLDVDGTTWGAYPRILFRADNHFYIGSQEPIAEGTYSQTGNVITLNYVDRPVGNGPYAKIIDEVGTTLTIVELDDDVIYAYKLVGSGGSEFFGMSPPEGAKRKVGNIAAYVYRAGGAANENARMREGPGANYNNVIYDGSQVIVPKGQEVSSYGRSENQTTIDGVTAYWYYCEYWIEGSYGSVLGWIWGGLLDFKK